MYMQRKILSKKDTLYQQFFSQDKVRQDYIELIRKNAQQQSQNAQGNQWPVYVPLSSFRVSPEKQKDSSLTRTLPYGHPLEPSVMFRQNRADGKGNFVFGL